MRNSRVWLKAALWMVLVGGVALAVVMTALGWDLSRLSTENYETREYSVAEDITSLDVKTLAAEVLLIPSEGDECRVVCYEQDKVRHTVAVKDGCLVIEANDTRKWYEYIGINFESPRVSVYIPAGEYAALSVRSDTGRVEIPGDFGFESLGIEVDTGDVSCLASVAGAARIRTSTGDITVSDATVGSLELSASTGSVTVTEVVCAGDVSVGVSTGRATLEGLVCKNLTSDGGTGSIHLKGVAADGQMRITRGTGGVTLDGSDAKEIDIETGTGSVEGSLLSGKDFVADSGTGSVKVPESVTGGGRCRISTGTGSINIWILE